jgi:hypothetical protein
VAEAHPAAAVDGRVAQKAVSFAPAYERDGTTVITATAVRTHTATRADGRSGRRPALDAELSGTRPMGAFVVRNGRVRWHPAVDWSRVITTAEVMVGGVLIAHRLAARPSAAKASVTMGPGGWVSMKGGTMAVRPAERGWRRHGNAPSAAPPRTRRPWWARLLAAAPLEALLG